MSSRFEFFQGRGGGYFPKNDTPPLYLVKG